MDRLQDKFSIQGQYCYPTKYKLDLRTFYSILGNLNLSKTDIAQIIRICEKKGRKGNIILLPWADIHILLLSKLEYIKVKIPWGRWGCLPCAVPISEISRSCSLVTQQVS